jgi:hypothetical protein
MFFPASLPGEVCVLSDLNQEALGGAAAGAVEVFEEAGLVTEYSTLEDGKEGGSVRRIRTVQHLGRPHFRIKNAVGTFLYDPVAGGFSSILDKQGNDWVGYADDTTGGYPAAAATKYRGVPNLVFGGDDDGAGHPGFTKCESRITRRNQITTVSISGEWEWRWTFYRTSARLDVIRTPEDRNYWFLYEGPASGKYLPRTTFWATDLSEPSYVIHDHYRGDVHRGAFRYMFFGEKASPYVFWMLQATPDTEPDHISYLGNEEIGARDSPDGMVVAGFGRAENATPMLSGPNSFLIGLTRHNAIDPLATIRTRKKIERIFEVRGK